MADLVTDQIPRRRGRPKGTGIDDSTVLRQIYGLMAADRSLKPTTAIKQCGIDNPSIVRRLREKLKSSPAEPRKAAAGPRAPSRSTTRATKLTALEPSTKPPPSTPPTPASNNDANSPRPTSASLDPVSADTAAREAQKTREAALLAAYLKALQQTAVPPLDEERSALRLPPEHQSRPPENAEPQPRQQPRDRIETQPATSPNPFAAFQPQSAGMPPAGMMFPFFPPFMQPFAPKPPPPNPMVQNQMEALRLSVEVMTAMTKLQMFAYQNTLAATPLGNMLQAQTMMGQMLLASFAGFTGLGKKPDSSK